MDFRNILEQAGNFIVYLATASPYIVPFWAAVLWLIVLLNWRHVVRLIWRSVHLVEDLVLQKELFAKIDKPLKVLLVLLAVLPFLHLVPGVAGAVLERLAWFALPLLTLYVIVQFVDTLFFTWYLGQRKEANIPSVLRFVILSGIYVLFGLAFLEWTLGINVLPLLATSTVVTAVVGLALQDTLKNLFAGLTMSFEKRFRQGDWVMFRIDANNTATGEVVEIGWRTTKIKTVDNNYVVIPNAMFTSNQMTNYSQPTPAFAKVVEIPVRTGVDLDKVSKAIMSAATSTEGVLKEPKAETLVSGIRVDHIVVRLRFWVSEYASSDPVAGMVMEKAYGNLAELKAVPATGALPELTG
jgi:small-conductance mechanosensitive channel